MPLPFDANDVLGSNPALVVSFINRSAYAAMHFLALLRISFSSLIYISKNYSL